MKITTSVFCIGLMASMAMGYVYSYQDKFSLTALSGEAEEGVTDGASAPADMSNIGVIAIVDAKITLLVGMTPSGNNGSILPADDEHFPVPLGGVLVESSGGLPNQPNAAPLSPGETVGPGSLWAKSGWVGGYSYGGQAIVGDPAFLSPNGAYVGVEFPDNNNQLHYGWLLVRYDQPAGTYFGTIELLEAGYETDPGVPITIAPEPAVGVLGFPVIFAMKRSPVRRRKSLKNRR